MISSRAKVLKDIFYNIIMDSGCDCDFDSAWNRISGDFADCDFLTIRQAFSVAACEAAASYIENCYDTPKTVENRKSPFLDPKTYAKWLADRLAEVSDI